MRQWDSIGRTEGCASGRALNLVRVDIQFLGEQQAADYSKPVSGHLREDNAFGVRIFQSGAAWWRVPMHHKGQGVPAVCACQWGLWVTQPASLLPGT